MTVYLDLVMGLNFLVDLFLLLGTNRLSGFPLGAKRCALGAAFGSLYSGACLLPGFFFLGSLLWRTVFLGIMGAMAFGMNRSALKRCGIFTILSLALGGAAVSIGTGQGIWLVLAAAGLWGLCHLVFSEGIGGREYVPMTISHGETSLSLIALKDSGNTLRDPITGERVFLIDGGSARVLTGLTEDQLRHPIETLAGAKLPGLRLIPYRAVGCEGGLLLGMRFSQVHLGEESTSAIIAFAPEGMGSGMHQALVTV